MKKFLKVLPLIILCFFAFTGCNFDNTVKKASKNLTNYSVVMALDDTNKTISANQKVDYINRTDVLLSTLCFNLYGNAFREGAKVKPYSENNEGKCFPEGLNYGNIVINSVKVKGLSVKYSIIGEDENILSIPLNEPLYPTSRTSIEIEWKLKLALTTHRLGYYNGNINLGNFYPIACMYEHGDFVMSPYYSTGDPFYSDIANYNISIEYPENYTLVSTGNGTGENNSNARKTSKFSASAVRDFAVVLSEKFEKKTVQLKNTTINYYGYEGDTDSDLALELSVKAFKFYSEKFGEYPYKTLNVVKTDFVHGGMEYPNLVMIADNIDDTIDYYKVIAHEIAHQWWYSVVGNDEINNAWLDEAVTEYSTVVFFEMHPEYKVTRDAQMQANISGYSLYTDVIKSIDGKINLSMELPVNKYNSEYEYVYMVYVKGTIMLDTLRTTIGDKAFFKGLKIYYKNNKFKIAKKCNLVASFEESSKVNLESFFTSWLSGEALVTKINP
ncbi:MAG: M1 family metallopeptidase [Clostridia bacterium]